MRVVPAIIIFLIALLQFNDISCQSDYGSVFPIPLNPSAEDSNFQYCPLENGVYAHTSNCSLFHMCTFGIHKIYSCIDGFFFDPNTGRCRYLSVDSVKCETIRQTMLIMNSFPIHQSRQVFNVYHRRKSAKSKCIQSGIYPDILDCSLFHYCLANDQHDIYKCPNGLHFDPKTFLCLAVELVNCQYEPSIINDDQIDTICREHPPGTYLPVINHFDTYIICKNDGKSILKRCESGFIYNALTTACEKGPCTFDSTLCKNEGQCIDEPTFEKGFKCICSSSYQGEYCEKAINLQDTIEQKISNHFRRLDETTHVPFTEEINLFQINQSAIPNKIFNKMLEKKSLLDSRSKQQQLFERLIKMITIMIITLVGLILFGSVIFGITLLTRFIIYSPVETVNEWKTLYEESII